MIAWAIWMAVEVQDAVPHSPPSSPSTWRQKEASSPLVDRGEDRSRAKSNAAVVETSELSPWRVAAWTAVVAGLLAALFLGLRRWLPKGGAAAPPEAICVVARRRVTPALEILVVEIAGRRLVLGAGKDSMNTLAELDPAEPAAPEETIGQPTRRGMGDGRNAPMVAVVAAASGGGGGGMSPA